MISVRYARALLKCAAQVKAEDAVYRDMQTLAESYVSVPQLRHTIAAPMLPREQKAQLLKTAAGGDVNTVTANLIDLILQQGREDTAQLIANSYVTLYRQQKNIISGRLTTAVPVSAAVQQKMKAMVESKTQGGTVEFQTDVNPDIIGGFVLEYDTYRMDNSVRSQLNNILKKLAV